MDNSMRNTGADKDMDRRQFIELLPFYLNGTLDEQERQRVDIYMVEHPEARAELSFSAALASATRAPLNERDPMAGYEELQRRMGSQHTDSNRKPVRELNPSRWWTSISQFFGGLGLSPAIAAVLVLLSAQIFVKSSLMGDPSASSEYRGGPQMSRNADLKMVVSPKASFEEIITLLVQNQCKIVWGPSTSGELWLAVDVPGAVSSVREKLASSPLVEDVQLLTAGPKR